MSVAVHNTSLGEIVCEISDRKGALRVRDVPSDVRMALSCGKIESKNLAELLAVDSNLLFKNVLNQIRDLGMKFDPDRIATYLLAYEPYATQKIMSQLRGAAKVLNDLTLDSLGAEEAQVVFNFLAAHPSDTVRSWACFMLEKRVFASNEREALKLAFLALRQFAADSHMGVRECAWMSLRCHIVEKWDGAKRFLREWLLDKNPNIRRTAVEASRPRGVWCSHFSLLKKHPEQALDLLELVKADPSRYVQNSLANWLNDAGKSCPDWVVSVCAQWEREGAAVETRYIIKRAMRNLR